MRSPDDDSAITSRGKQPPRRVILLHGPPACGKLTIARCLAEHIEAVILHNHLTFNLARELFSIGDQRLLDLHRELRMVMLRHALAPTEAGATPVPDLVLTLVYAEPGSVANLTQITGLIEESGAQLLPVYLQCTRETLLRRVQSADREKEGKLHTPTRLEVLLAENHYPPLPHAQTRIIDNDDLSADAAALEILRALSLNS